MKKRAKKLSDSHRRELSLLRTRLQHGDCANQKQLNQLVAEWSSKIGKFGNDELLGLVDSQGNFNSLYAPRWLCHLLGLRHLTIQVLLLWESPKLGEVAVLQIRSFDKKDYPGHIDLSVGGHIGFESMDDPIGIAYKEMDEELGLSPTHLINDQLEYRTGYNSHTENEDRLFYNYEWNIIFNGKLRTQTLDSLKFRDGEVSGLCFYPMPRLRALSAENTWPLAPGLMHYLERFPG